MLNKSVGAATPEMHRDGNLSHEPPPDFMFIGELAQVTNTNPKTIRFYEQEGLINPVRHGRFRVYSRADERQLRTVLKMRAMGLSLAQIRSVLDQPVDAEDSLRTPKFAALLTMHLGELRRRHACLLSEIEAVNEALSNYEVRQAS
jgi:DNA-binding transcriptional MerR regulator